MNFKAPTLMKGLLARFAKDESGATAVASGLLAALGGMSGAELLSHLGAGAAVLTAAFACFACGWIGGGDAKLAAATALWLGFSQLFDYLIYASLLGGALKLLIVLFRIVPL